MTRTKLICCFAVLGMVLMGGGTIAQENPDPSHPNKPGPNRASGGQLSIQVDSTDGTCLGTNWVITFGYSFTTDDTSGVDQAGFVAYDGDGVALSADWTGTETSVSRDRPFGPLAGQINMITARPITIDLHDVNSQPVGGWNTQAVYDSVLANSIGILTTLVYDPAEDVADCTSLPDRQVPTAGPMALALLAVLLLLIGWTFIAPRFPRPV